MADNPNKDPKKDGKAPEAPSKLEELILGLDAKIQQLSQTQAGQRSLYDRQIQGLQAQLARALQTRRSQQEDDDYREEAPRREKPEVTPADERKRMRSELLEFKVDHGSDYFTRKAKVDALVNDPVWQASEIVYNEEGGIDYTKTYRNALREVIIQEGNAARQASEEAKKADQSKKDAAKKEATLSGDAPADEIPEGILDKPIEDLTDAELDQVMGMKPKRVAPVGVATSR